MDKQDPNVSREMIRNPVRNVAVVGLLRPDDRILLVRTKRLPNHWQPIGGGVKAHDRSAEEALVRELREEVGISIDPCELRFELSTPYDFGEGTVVFFTVRVPEDVALDFDETELAEWGWFSVDEALQLPSFPASQKFFEHLLPRARESCQR